MAKELKQSETRVLWRSQIKQHPQNPKNHTDEEIKLQLKNFKKYGYLGGIIFNEPTGELISGHRRIAAMDLYYKYDGTKNTDYEVKVEISHYDEKEALEQMTFLSGINDGKPDYNKIAKYIHDIDTTELGLSDSDVEQIKMLSDDINGIGSEETIADIAEQFLSPTPDEQMPPAPQPKPSPAPAPITELPHTEKTSEEIVQEHADKPKMTKEEVKDAKQHCNDVASERQEEQDLYMFVTFANFEQKRILCELLQRIPENSMQVSGDELLSLF